MIPTLTFDDGPSEWTDPILDLLAEHHTTAVFFVIGAHIQGREETLQRMSAHGHVIGNHTFTHAKSTTLDDEDFVDELASTNDAIREVTGERPVVWRAPFFAMDTRTIMLAKGLELMHVDANVVPDDWREDDGAVIAERVLHALRHDSVVCLHDGIPPRGASGQSAPSRAGTVEAVRLILEATT